MNELRFYEAKSNFIMLIMSAITFGILSTYFIYTSYFTLHSDFSIKKLIETLVIVMLPIGLFLLSCFGIYLSKKSKEPIIVINDNGISFPSLGKDSLSWHEIRWSEISDRKIYIYIKSKEINEIPPTVYFHTKDIDHPDKLLKWVIYGIKKHRGDF